MKSEEIRTEEDIDKRLSELELKKFTHISQQIRRRFVGCLVTPSVFLIVIVLSLVYPSMRESITSTIGDILHDVVNWYILAGLLIVIIIKKLLLYRVH